MGGPCDCDGETHSELDNFHNCRFKVQVAWLQLSGEWPSAEAAFQAAKFPEDPAAQEELRKSSGGLESFKQGRDFKLRPDWEEIKVHVMYEVNKAKFTQNPALKDVLLRGHGPITARGGLFWKTWNEVRAGHKKYKHVHTCTSGSFSAISTPIFATKYSFFSIFETYKMCILLHRSNLSNLAMFRQHVKNCLLIV